LDEVERTIRLVAWFTWQVSRIKAQNNKYINMLIEMA